MDDNITCAKNRFCYPQHIKYNKPYKPLCCEFETVDGRRYLLSVFVYNSRRSYCYTFPFYLFISLPTEKTFNIILIYVLSDIVKTYFEIPFVFSLLLFKCFV